MTTARTSRPASTSIVADAMADVMHGTDERSTDLRNRLFTLASRALEEAEFDLDHGDPAARNSVIRALLPVMAREAASSADDPRIRALEEMVAGMRVEFGGEFGAARNSTAPAINSQATEDTPMVTPIASPVALPAARLSQ